jgi:ATP-dependent Clp protease ATP-binding subunit ClpC
MFERYSERARRAIFFARYSANQFNAAAIEDAHLLLGVLREDVKLSRCLFDNPEGAKKMIEQRLAPRMGSSPSVAERGDIPLSEDAKRALTFGAEEAESLGSHTIDTQHLVMGLLRTEGALSMELLQELRVDLTLLRKEFKPKPGDSGASARFEDRDAPWLQELSSAAIEKGLITREELSQRCAQVAAMRHFSPEVEAILDLLASKGLADPSNLAALAFELRDQRSLLSFLKRIAG